MKITGKLLITLVLLVLASSLITIKAADFTREQTGYRTMGINKQIYPDGTYSLFSSATIHYGASIPPQPSTKNLFRSIWDFAIPSNLPAGSYVKKVELKWNTNSSTGFDLGYVSDYPATPTLEQKWDLTENAINLTGLVGSNGQLWTQEIPEFLEYLRQAHDQGKARVYLSFRAYTELMNTDLVQFSQLTLKITYEVRVKYFVENNFLEGQLKVNGITKNHGEPVYLIEQTSNNFEAIEPQTSSSNMQYVWNDTEFPNYKSNWELKNLVGDKTVQGESMILPHTAASGEMNYTMIANLRKNFAISRTDNFSEFDGTVSAGVVHHIVEQNSGQVSAPINPPPVNGKQYTFSYWADNFSHYNQRTITPTDNVTFNAVYKYPNHSNNTSAYSSNSQKKLVRTTDGRLHKVYESMNMVWYEVSTDNGITWTVQNNGKPLSSNYAKQPSIDFSGNSYIFIVWQEKITDGDAETYKVRLAYLHFPDLQFVFYDVWNGFDWAIWPPYSFNATPVIAWINNRILIAWRDSYGLNYRYGSVDCYGPMTWYNYPFGMVTGTDANSINPTLAVRKDGGSTVFHLGWQQGTTAIKYASLTPDAGNNIVQSTIETPSSGDGFNYRVNPSISIKSDGYPTIVYIGSIYQGATTQVTRRPRSSSTWGTFGKYGSSVSSPTEYDNIIVWSESNANKLYRPWGGLRTLSTVGNSVQMSNGTSKYAIAYRPFSPYDFQTSPELHSLAKENSIVNQCGREAIVSKGDADFYLILADVTAGNDVIKFNAVNDDLLITNLEELNQNLFTNSFDVTENTNFTFSLAYGTIDSIKAIESLSDATSIQFNIELIDANTNEILGTFENIIFNSNNINTYRDQTYNVNLQGIGEKTVKMRVVTNTNFIGEYNLADIVTEESVLGKNNSKEIKLTGESIVNTYDLLQNYPNPFNPATNIVYQLPKDGFVTIKVYDVLGNEIKTLVNEQKATGRYEISFDASEFSSGVYIYKIQANDFVSSKKMMLIK